MPDLRKNSKRRQKVEQIVEKEGQPGCPKSAANFSLKDTTQLSPSKPIPDAVKKVVGHLVSIQAKQTTGHIISFPSTGPATWVI